MKQRNRQRSALPCVYINRKSETGNNDNKFRIHTVDKAPEPRLKDTLRFVISEKSFLLIICKHILIFFNEMPRNLMISGHLRFSFFSSLRYFCTATLERKRNSGTFSTVSQLVENYFFDKLNPKLLPMITSFGLFFAGK